MGSLAGYGATAQGLFQICELGWQLRGEAGARQVPNAKLGLGQTLWAWAATPRRSC